MQSIETRLQQIIDKWSVLEHPFYQAWTAGTLPSEKIKVYANEYATFIRKIADAWLAVGDEAIAEEELEHYNLWIDFSKSLGNNEAVEVSRLDAVEKLVRCYEESLPSEATALGALYAFEQQQPGTAQSKLDGLRNHYKALGADETYFDIHKDDFEEPAILLKRIKSLPEAAQEKALESCNVTCEKIWNALSGVLEAE